MKLSKAASTRIDQLATEAGKAYAEMTTALETYNQEVEEAKGKLEDAVAKFNESREALHSELESERDQFQSEFDDRSERWQEGEKGEAARSFIDAIDEAMGEFGEEVEVEFPDEVSIEANNPEEVVGNMPRESEE